MPLNILLADDSVPAQNMGKKILMDAGYGVVTVSNGLEALRKIADAVPDIAILDIFMPGYTGLEICKRLRSSAATATIPVILTVGKLEPYRPEDGEEVQSNAVIVKPFAAAELISAVRSLIGEPTAESQIHPGLEAKSQAAVAGDAEGNSLTAGQSAAPEPAAVPEEQDEPLFADAAPAAGAGGYADVQTPSIFYSGESLLAGASGADPSGPSSLAFDPDAKPTPFSASAVELLSPASPAAAEDGAYASGEFDLGMESFPAAEAEAGRSTVEDESSLPAPAVQEVAQEAAQEVAQETTHEATLEAAQEGFAATAGPDAAEPAVAAPLSETAPEAIASASFLAADLVAAEVESSGLEAPALDPLLEVPEAAGTAGVLTASMLSDSSILEEDAAQSVAEPAPEEGAVAEEIATYSAAHFAEDEEARIAAFEALFNSTEALPLDEAPADHVAAAQAVSAAGVAEAPQENAYELEAEPEIATLADDRLQHFAAAEVDPNPLEEAQCPLEDTELESEPLIAMGTNPELLSDPLDEVLTPTEWTESGSAWQPEVLAASASHVSQELHIGRPMAEVEHQPTGLGVVPALSSEAAPVEAAAVAAQPLWAEAHPEAARAYEPTPSSEILETAPDLAPEAAPEVVTPEAVVPEAVPMEARQPAPELLHSELDLPLAAAAPAQVEAVPAQVEAPAAAEAIEPAPLRPEAPMAEISSPPALSSRLIEAERIHHAVERVFDRFKPLLVAAIVRELARHD